MSAFYFVTFFNILTKLLKLLYKNSEHIHVIRQNNAECVSSMYEDLMRKQIIIELKNLIKKAETIDNDKDTYCEFMKDMILNTYSVN